MSEINSSNQSLTKILDKLGINSAKEKFTLKKKGSAWTGRFFKTDDNTVAKSRSFCTC